MTFNQIAFLLVAGIAAIAASGVVVFGQNPVRSALCLVLNFFLLAILYFMLGAQLLGITQVMVYAGAIMVLFLFVIMVLQLRPTEKGRSPRDGRWAYGLIGAGALAAVVATSALSAIPPSAANPIGPEFGTPQAVGAYLFTQYAWPFEIASVLLLVGIVGSILLAKRRL